MKVLVSYFIKNRRAFRKLGCGVGNLAVDMDQYPPTLDYIRELEGYILQDIKDRFDSKAEKVVILNWKKLSEDEDENTED